MKEMEGSLEHTANEDQLRAREYLLELFKESPIPDRDLLFNLGLYARSGLLVKFLCMYELYQRVLNVPGIFVEFGCWYGQNAVLLENLRAILEPFNKSRRLVLFDTFTGYQDTPGWYSTGKEYKDYLYKILDAHVRCNVYGHIEPGHEIIEGDVVETAPRYFDDHQEAIVAMAYFDIGTYEPTLTALEAITPHLVPGSVILFDELTLAGGAGEARAFKEVFKQSKYKLEKMSLYPSKSLLTVLP